MPEIGTKWVRIFPPEVWNGWVFTVKNVGMTTIVLEANGIWIFEPEEFYRKFAPLGS